MPRKIDKDVNDVSKMLAESRTVRTEDLMTTCYRAHPKSAEEVQAENWNQLRKLMKRSTRWH